VNGAYSDGTGRKFMGISTIQSAQNTVQCVGRVRDIKRDGKGGYSEFVWLVKPDRRREFYEYAQDSTAAWYKNINYCKFKNTYEYQNHLIINNVQNLREKWFNMISFDVIDVPLDENNNINNVDLNDIKLSGVNSKNNIQELIILILGDGSKPFDKFLKTESDGTRKSILSYCRNRKKEFSAYIKDIKKLSFKVLEDFYYRDNNGFEKVKMFINRCARGRVTIDTFNMSEYFNAEAKVINEFMKTLMEFYAEEVTGGYKSLKRWKFNGRGVNWDHIHSMPISKTKFLIELSNYRMNDSVNAETEKTLDMIFEVAAKLGDNEKRYAEKFEGKYEGKYDYYTISRRGKWKKFSSDKDKRYSQYRKANAADGEITTAEAYILNRDNKEAEIIKWLREK
jgi:hypothetical protein